MSQVADLYAIIRFYANRTRTSTFPVDVFVSFLEKYAKRYAAERPDLAPWAEDTSRKVWAELSKLAEAGKCPISSDERGTLVSVAQFFVDLLQQTYRTVDETPELPFPDETSLNIVVPPAQLRTVTLDVDLSAFLGEAAGTTQPVIKLTFPEGAGSTLLLAEMLPKRLLELALIKIRHYLRSHNNKEYIQHKLAPAFQGKEAQLKDTLTQLMVRPGDSMTDLESAGDFSFQFWAYFASLVKGDILKKNDKLSEDIAALQAVYIIEFFNNYYKGKVQKERDTETAFRNLEQQLDKPPFYYTMDDVVRFTDTKGVPLLGQYTKEALETYFKNKTTSGSLDKLPELLTVHGLGGERWFVRKSKMMPLCVKLLGDARPRIKNTLTQRWFKLMGDYRSESAMENDDAFDNELAELTGSLAPILSALLQEKTLYLVHEELEGTEAGVPETTRLFYKGALAPMSELYLLTRSDLITDVRMLLPFWYSIPVISGIIAFFKRMGKSKNETKRTAKRVVLPEAEETVQRPESGTAAARKEALKKAAREVQRRLLPKGVTMDAHLSDLADRWNRIINPQAKANLTEDVNSLIRDYVRRTARTLRAANFTTERISELASSLSEAPALQKLPARDSLRLYIQLYIVKLILKS
jgi:hypothetical protein